MNVIGVAGLAGAGKDTIAARLCAEHGFVRVALADPLKRIARDAFAFTDAQLWGPSEERNKPDARYPRDHAARTGVRCSCCGADVDVESDAPCYLTPRYALQLLGTEWGRHCYDGVWVDYAMRVASTILNPANGMGYDPRSGLHRDGLPYRGVVVSDVRFSNEALAIRRAGGKVWRVERPGAGLSGGAAQHVSERGIPDDLVDAEILNDGTIEELHGSVDAVLGGF